MKRFFGMILALGIFSSAAFAHNGMEHVMGTVTALTESSVTVMTTDGKSQSVMVTNATKYGRGTQAIAMKDIKIGDHVVIHAAKNGDSLVAHDVKVGMMKKKVMPRSGRGVTDGHPKAQAGNQAGPLSA